MNRTAVAAFLGLALVFAALPGVMALSFLGGSSEASPTIVSTPTVDFRIDGEHQMAFGLDGKDGGCPLEEGADTSGL